MTIERQIRHLIKALLDWEGNYVGIDITMRQDDDYATISVYADEEHLPENTSDDDIARLKEKLESLKEKLELLKKIEELVERLNKTRTCEPIYVRTPWPEDVENPWWVWYKTDNNRINYKW